MENLESLEGVEIVIRDGACIVARGPEPLSVATVEQALATAGAFGVTVRAFHLTVTRDGAAISECDVAAPKAALRMLLGLAGFS